MSKQIKIPLMGPIGATQLQNNGYKNSATAIAEIVDNSIQAKAKIIDIILVTAFEHNKHKVKHIVISDDGIGMDETVFSNALQFQGGTNHRATSGLGKYGMGLPASSCNQTKHFEIYTWKTNSNNNKKLLFNYLDLDEIEKTGNPYLNPVEEKNGFDDRIIKGCYKKYSENNSGTLVYWKDVNRLSWINLSSLIDHIEKTLGRKFRYYLYDKKIKMSIKVFTDNGQNIEEVRKHNKNCIKYFDPMFLMESAITKDVAECRDFNGVTSQKYGNEILKSFHEKINLHDGTIRNVEHKIRLKFSHVKKDVRQWYKDNGKKRAGSTALGKLYKNRNDINVSYPVISILRANREIDHHNYGFVQLSTGTKYEMERWYSVELFIDTPESDWLFEIDNRKQNAKIYKISDASDFRETVHKYISRVIENNISEMRTDISNQLTSKNRSSSSARVEVGDIADDFVEVPHPIDGLGPSVINDNERKEIRDWIVDIYPHLIKDKDRLKNVIEWCLALPCRHYIIYRPLGQMDLYSFKSMGTDRTVIEINTNHSFYQEFIAPIESDKNEQAKDILRLLFSSLVSAEQSATSNSQEKKRLLRRIRTNMATELDEFIEELMQD